MSASTGLTFSQLVEEQEFWDAMTISETHVVTAAGIFNDPGPNHLNRLQAASSRWESPIAHGTLLSGVMMGVIGNALGPMIVAMLELSSTFVAPVHVGKTFITHWQVAELTPKPKFDGGGIVVFDGEGLTDDATTAIRARAVLAVGESAPWDPARHVRSRR